MTYDEVVQYVDSHPEVVWVRDRRKDGKVGYVCPFPFCKSGTGKSGTGMSSKDGKHWTCWKCGTMKNNDVLDYIGMEYGLQGYREKVERAAELYGLTIDKPHEAKNGGRMDYNASRRTDGQKRKAVGTGPNKAPSKEREAEQTVDYSAFIEEAAQHIQETDYHRGISLETLQLFKVGFCRDWVSPTPKDPTKKQWPSPRLIIPTSKGSYIARLTSQGSSSDEKGKRIRKAGKLSIFNSDVMYSTWEPVFIAEGEIDALSIEDVGCHAIGLGGTSGKTMLLEMIREKRPSCSFVLVPDRDEAGRNAMKEIAEALQEEGIPFIISELGESCPGSGEGGRCKDANEALNADREAFTAKVKEVAEEAAIAVKEAAREAERQREEEREELLSGAADQRAAGLLERIQERSRGGVCETGIDALDKLLDGGLYAGLYTIGAVTSLGKTTFCVQIADQIAAAGRDVLYISLEMSSDELIAKSISRHTLLQDLEIYGTSAHAKTTRGILSGHLYNKYGKEERAVIDSAIESYRQYASHIFIEEGIGNVDVESIRSLMEKHIRITGSAPVLLVDYVQILAPLDVRASDKQNMDKSVLELKRISRDFNTPVIAISSLNRNNYNEPINNAAFKESGALEYGSDVLIGLQYLGMDYQSGESDSKRRQRLADLKHENENAVKFGKPQKIQVKILKNRNGQKGDFALDFYPALNYFKPEALKAALDTMGQKQPSGAGSYDVLQEEDGGPLDKWDHERETEPEQLPLPF